MLSQIFFYFPLYGTTHNCCLYYVCTSITINLMIVIVKQQLRRWFIVQQIIQLHFSTGSNHSHTCMFELWQTREMTQKAKTTVFLMLYNGTFDHLSSFIVLFVSLLAKKMNALHVPRKCYSPTKFSSNASIQCHFGSKKKTTSRCLSLSNSL